MKQATFDDAIAALEELSRIIATRPKRHVEMIRPILLPIASCTRGAHRVCVMTYELLRTRAKPFSPEAAILEEIAILMPYVQSEQAPATDQGGAAAKGE